MKKFFVYFTFISVFFNFGTSQDKMVALTFDDGPSRYTESIMDYLYSEGANATFFVMGNKINNNESTIIKMYCYNFQIGNHTYSHMYLPNKPDETIKYEINKTNLLIKQITGYSPVYLRPSYGSINKRIRSLTDMEIVLWDIDTLDWKIKNSNTVYKKIIKKVKNEDIILFHDTYKRTLKTLKLVVPELKKQGYRFVTVEQLKEYQSFGKF